MVGMFYDAHAFNQALPFDTSKVMDVRVYHLCLVQLDFLDSDVGFLPTILPDVYNVLRGFSLQSITTNLQYFRGYNCECIFLLSPT